ncbi:MAG: phage tail assembly chaperone [Planctomycetota bacterium]
MAAGVKVDALEREPQLYEDLVPVWNAFLALDRARSVGFVPNPITVEAIAVYLDLYAVEGDERRLWFERIQAMDAACLGWRMDRAERERKR